MSLCENCGARIPAANVPPLCEGCQRGLADEEYTGPEADYDAPSAGERQDAREREFEAGRTGRAGWRQS